MAKRIYCNSMCKESYSEDRKAGLIYGSVKMLDGRILNHFMACLELRQCPYCLASVEVYKLRAAGM